MKSSAGLDSVSSDVRSLGERYGLAAEQIDQLMAILARVVAAAAPPTAVREPIGVVQTHLADSLVALELGCIRSTAVIADLGSGAGFPGLALAVALPRSTVRLVESQRRKCAFIDDLCRAGGIGNARVVCARAEEWEAGVEANDVVLARALAAQSVVLEYAAPLLQVGGMLVDWRGRRNADEERGAARAALELGLQLVEIRRVEPYAEAREHRLHLYEKVEPTPMRFPRRAGIARKRPLGC